MPRTMLQRKADAVSDPCKAFRVILKKKMYDDEHRKRFTNNDIAGWINQSPANVSEKMRGKRDFSFGEMRIIISHVGFSSGEMVEMFF